MKTSLLLLLVVKFALANFLLAQTPASQDTIVIPGGTMAGGENAGLLEETINGDITASGARINPNRVYALREGQVYYQFSPINVNNPTGSLTIVGVPSVYGKTKPIILIIPVNGSPILSNKVYGSLKFENIHYQSMHLDGTQNGEFFYCGTADKLPQSLTIDNCLFEFCNVDLFDCTDELGAIGGWPYEAKFRITNSYFRNMFHSDQWWGSRIFQCKHPIDTLWVENCTVTSGGMTFLVQNSLTKFAYFNHNTIINNKKNWLTSPYYLEFYVTNNIFINQNWVGEDTNVISSGTDPNKQLTSTIFIDTLNFEQPTVIVQPQYYIPGTTDYTDAVNAKNMKVYVSNNINYDSPELADGYYKSSTYIIDTLGTPPSYLNWAGYGGGPWAIRNQPGMWMNPNTRVMFDKYAPHHVLPNFGFVGGFVEENTITEKPQTVTPITLDANEVQAMAQWNQSLWGDPRFTTPTPNIFETHYVYGDYLPMTLPGKVNGVASDAVTAEGAGIQVGITKFTDLTENFYQTTKLSTIDNLPIGALIWNDDAIAAYNSAHEFQEVMNAYAKIVSDVKITDMEIPEVYRLLPNYPNPFNPTTTINFSIPKTGVVKLVVYNMLGQKIRTLVDGELNAGHLSATWDGKDSKGMSVSSGIYFYRLSAGDFTATHKMILMK